MKLTDCLSKYPTGKSLFIDQGQDSLQRSFFMHIRDQVLHEVFFAECVQDIIPLDDIIIKDACRLDSDVYCLLRHLQTYRQVTDTVCYEIQLSGLIIPHFQLTRHIIMNLYAKCECVSFPFL